MHTHTHTHTHTHKFFTAATWVPVTAVLGALFVVCLLVGLLVVGRLLYRKRIQKPRLSLEPVKFTNTNEVLAIDVNPQVEDGLENRIASEDNKLAPFLKYEVSFFTFFFPVNAHFKLQTHHFREEFRCSPVEVNGTRADENKGIR